MVHERSPVSDSHASGLLEPYLARVARHPLLAELRGPLTRYAATMFVDLTGFTQLSERLARHGTAGTEQLGRIVRRVIGGSLDTVASHGGDSLAFGGDAITATFSAPSGWSDARASADDVIRLVADAAGMQSLIGPVDISVRIGVSGGRVTTLVCPSRSRRVVVHLGPGLDAAVAAQQQAASGAVVVNRAADGTPLDALELGDVLPPWAGRVLHPVATSRILAAGGLPDEHRRVTSVFLSMPPVDDRNADALAGFARFVSIATDLIGETGGDVLQCTGGDKGVVLFAVFGVPVAHPDDPLRAVHAVERLRASAGTNFGAGVATGLTFTAAFGGRARSFPSALGDTTNLAARLMAAAGSGHTLVDAATATAVPGSVTVGRQQTLTVKGKAEPVAVTQVTGLATPTRRFDAGGDTPLVGRTSELATAEGLMDDASRGVGGILYIVGEAGSGKSSLVKEVVRRAWVRHLQVRLGVFEAFGLGRPLGPFAELLRLRLGRDAVTTGDGLAAAISAIRPGGGALAPLLASMLDLVVEETGLTAALTEEHRSELTRGLVIDLLCSNPDPTLIVLDDTHWADEASLRLIDDLAPRLPNTSLALVITERRDAGADHDDDGRYGRTVTLADLPPSELATVVGDTWSRLGGGALPQGYLDTLVERSAGRPLFAETVTELVRRSFRPGEPLPEVPLPDELFPFLTARLDALGHSAQHTALCAAALGRPTSAAEIYQIFGVDQAAAESDLAVLETTGIVRRFEVDGASRVWLRHATVAEALLARASHADRAPLHERVVWYLIGSGASAREISRHLEQCRLPDIEGRWYRDARTEAASTWALGEARHWANLAAARSNPTDTPTDILALAELEQQLGEYAPAKTHLAALEACPEVAGTVERLLGRIAFETGRPKEAVEHLTRAEDSGERGAAVSWPLTMALCDLGRFDQARARAAAQLRTAGDADPRGRLDALANLGVVAFREGDLVEASAVLEEARDIALELGDLLRLAHVIGDLAGARFANGRLADSAALLDEATALAHQLGARRLVAMTLGNLTQVRLAGGDRQGAVRTAVATADSALGIGDTAIALDCLQVPAVVAELDGNHTEAAAWWRRHAQLEERLGRTHDAAISWLRHATLLAVGGDDAGRLATISHADEVAADLTTDDLELHHARALAARSGSYTPPPEGVTAPIALPPLDAALPLVSPSVVDALFDRVEHRLMPDATHTQQPLPDKR
jgi:class 3 adenylate cyclase/tetratricopeptide (TPR) repeat protein